MKIVLLLPAKHPLASKKVRLWHASWLAIRCCCLRPGPREPRLDSWLEPVEDDLRISMELDSTEMIKRFVMAGLGLSFLAASHCREEVASGKLCCVSLGPDPDVAKKVALIYRKDKALSKAALGFIQVILEQAKVEGSANLAKLPAAVAT